MIEMTSDAERIQAAAPTTERPCCAPFVARPVSDRDAEAAAAVFRALADPARVRLVSMIATSPEREACVCDLVPAVGLSQPTVSHHLKILLEAGIVSRERRGSWAYYRLEPEVLDEIRSALA